MRTTKKGKELYEELVKPMKILARRIKSMSVKEWSEIRKRTIEDWVKIMKRGKPRIVKN